MEETKSIPKSKSYSALKKISSSSSSCHHSKTNLITYIPLLLLITFILLPSQSPPWNYFNHHYSTDMVATLLTKLRDSVTFLPLKDVGFSETPREGNTWFMSSLNDTHEPGESEYLYFPSKESKGRVLCIKGRNKRDGTKNSYALAFPESLPRSAKLLKGVTFVSDTYYDYTNLWHGVSAMAPFVGWSIKNDCLKPTRFLLFHWGELRDRMGSWLQTLMQSAFGEVKVKGLDDGDDEETPYCFEKAVVMRHNQGSMGKKKKLEVFKMLRCRARVFCAVNPVGRGREVDERGEPVVRVTLLMRRGSRSFKDPTAVIRVFAKECAKIKGCVLKVAQSEDLRFCDQVRVMTETDVVASPHGAQLTNMLFMDQNSSVMEFFPKGWLELAGVGQYAHHWMADQSGMRHEGSWWEPLAEKECPSPQNNHECFRFYKNGQVGHNETFFSQWASDVFNRVRIRKLEQAKNNYSNTTTHFAVDSSACMC